LEDYPQMMDQNITCRLLKIELGNGEKGILRTSLTDLKKYECLDFDGFYHYRWYKEEVYK